MHITLNTKFLILYNNYMYCEIYVCVKPRQ